MLRRTKGLASWLTCSLLLQGHVQTVNSLPFELSLDAYVDWSRFSQLTERDPNAKANANQLYAGEPNLLDKRATFSSIVQGPAPAQASSPASSQASIVNGTNASSLLSSLPSSLSPSILSQTIISGPSVAIATAIVTITETSSPPPAAAAATSQASNTTPIPAVTSQAPVSTPQSIAQQQQATQIINAPAVVIIENALLVTSAVVVTNGNGQIGTTNVASTLITTITTTTNLLTTTVTTSVIENGPTPLGVSTAVVELGGSPATIIVKGGNDSPPTTQLTSTATAVATSVVVTGTPAPVPAASSTTVQSQQQASSQPASSAPASSAPAASVTSQGNSAAAPSTTAVPQVSQQTVNTPASPATTTAAAAPSVLTTPAAPPTATTNTGLIQQSSQIIFPVFSSLETVATTAAPTITSQGGSINTVLPTSGRLSIVPFPNGTITQVTLSLVTSAVIGTNTVVQLTPISNNIFVPIETTAPPAYVPVMNNHPVQGAGVVGLGQTPIETNKFYTNLMVGDQTLDAYPYPYALRWTKGGGASKSWGMAISHIERSQVSFGPGTPPEYYVNPGGIDSMVLSASELGGGTTMTTDTHLAFSVNANFLPQGANTPKLTIPIVQGMGFVTGIYNGASVLVQSGVSFKQLSPVTNLGTTQRWLVLLSDGHEWGIWITPNGGGAVGNLTLSNDGITITGPKGFSGLVQIAKIENQGEELVYDQHAGAYATSITLSASASGEYSLAWNKGGNTGKTLVTWALPHHVQSFTTQTAGMALNMSLDTLTAGAATAVAADQWFLQENMPTNMGFEPWAPPGTANVSFASLSANAKNLIHTTCQSELSQNMQAQTNINTIYFSGKALAKFAMLVYTASELLEDATLANSGLVALEAAFNLFVQNKGAATFAYDNTWKGMVDPAGYAGGPSADFGNTYYNDHMFHYGYVVYTAAVVAHLDPKWLAQNNNKDFINSLVRDYSNSIENDPYFPFSRNFDWYSGHSWAGGLFPISDGKDLESTSEDTFASYAVKMWGMATGDSNMEARGNLMLAVQARALNNYVFMQDSNTVQPSQYIPNRVAGITFQNKLDHTTYFGSNIEYIEGIHMIPVASHSGFMRPAAFINEEWSTYFSNGRVDAINSGWKGVIYADYALSSPKTAWNFFSQANFNTGWLDGGASLTWYLVMAAMFGGAS